MKQKGQNEEELRFSEKSVNWACLCCAGQWVSWVIILHTGCSVVG
jgi:hypothetical protein